MKIFLRGILILLLTLGLFACVKKEDPLPEGEVSKGNESNFEADNQDSDSEGDNLAGSEEEPPELDDEEDSEGSLGEIDIFSDTSEAVLVNKFNSLSDYYAPEDLVKLDVPTILENPEVNQLRELAAEALYEMFEEAKASDVILYARSGYRSYETQIHLFNNYAEKHGEAAANKFSARPGFSEHQTGLVMDVTSESVNFQLSREFGETREGLWLAENAHRFGFIIRYPEGKEDITGYVYEPWHVRYLGIDLATAVYESGLSYEEFLVEEGIIHAVNAKASE